MILPGTCRECKHSVQRIRECSDGEEYEATYCTVLGIDPPGERFACSRFEQVEK